MAAGTSCPTVEELQDLMCGESGIVMLPDKAFDEVHPGILIGEASIALNTARIKAVGITHVLNCAEGSTRFHVKTGSDFYGDAVSYYGIEATDVEGFQLRPLFDGCSDFIATAVGSGGKVLVHCREGVSRSTTIVLAYLLDRCGMSLRDAVVSVHRHRNVYPNDGFLQQLIAYEQALLKQKS